MKTSNSQSVGYESRDNGNGTFSVIQHGNRTELAKEKIRIITTGAMQTRFTLDEEVAIVEGVDTRAKVMRDRLLGAKCADLDLDELQYGIAYLVNYLHLAGVLNAIDEVTRTEELLRDGDITEQYSGIA